MYVIEIGFHALKDYIKISALLSDDTSIKHFH